MKSKLAYATSVHERMGLLSLYYREGEIEDNLAKWLSRRSLCTEELFDLSLKERQLSRKSFNLAIKPLKERDMELLAKKSKSMNWYQKTIEICGNEEIDKDSEEDIDFSYAIRPFLYYLKSEIKKVDVRGFTICSLEAFVIHLAKELAQISSKTLVFDLHEQKKKSAFKGATSNERFTYYMRKRFGNRLSIIEFYEDYPVLYRLLTERVLFHIDNYREFVLSIEQSLPRLEETFSLTAPYKVEKISLGAGDSHGKGKTVILFEMNGQRLVFKYKNLEIGERFNSFLAYLEKRTGKSFFKIKRVVGQSYCIEEFVAQQECKTEKEVQKFYHRFGEYVALAYLLCGNDFHYENLIAHGAFPVLIDIETLIQNDNPIKYAENPFVELSMKKFSSVLGSALLPMKFFENRVEPLAGDGPKGLRISAFDGNKQKSPYKGLGLVDPNTDEVRYEYIEYELDGSNNIPTFEGNEVKAELYKADVVKGFDEICEYFKANSDEIASIVEDVFANVIVRNVIKSTQKYSDMLGYGYHPKCMQNYIEREKLFENLWAFEYKNKAAILTEIEELLVNDVPIFFNNTSSKDLSTSEGRILKDYYKRTAIERVKSTVLNFDEKEHEYQRLRLELSLGIFKLQTEVVKLGASTKELMHGIMDTVCNRARYDKNKSSVTFEDFIYELDGTLDHGALNGEFYDGLSGIYLFVLYYTKSFTNSKAETLKLALENSLFKLPSKKEKQPRLSAYLGKYSVLYPLYHKYRLEQDDKDLLFAEKLIADIDEEISHKTDVDWMNGVSGLIQVLFDYYQLTEKQCFMEKAELLSEMLDKRKVQLCGFAHGFSGIIYASYSLYRYTGKQVHLERVREYLKEENQYFDGKVWADLRKGKNLISQWCHGTVGIGLTRLYLLKHGFEDEQAQKDLYYCVENVLNTNVKESGICHGDIGRFLFLKEVQKSQLLKQTVQQKVDSVIPSILNNIFSNGIVVDSYKGQSLLGMMTGISGIGYGLLKEVNSGVPNILGLE